MTLADDDLYRSIILEHASRPPHRGRLEDATHQEEGVNPSCGDEVELFLRVRDATIEEATFDGVGCSICMASASMLTQALRGKTTEEAHHYYQAFKTWLTARDPQPSPVDLEDLEALGGVRNYPVRLKCALLAWETFSAAMSKN